VQVVGGPLLKSCVCQPATNEGSHGQRFAIDDGDVDALVGVQLGKSSTSTLELFCLDAMDKIIDVVLRRKPQRRVFWATYNKKIINMPMAGNQVIFRGPPSARP
jgi:hypothetical protein